MLTVWDWQKNQKLLSLRYVDTSSIHFVLLSHILPLPSLPAPFLCSFLLDFLALILFPSSPFFSVIFIAFQMASFSSFYVLPCLFHLYLFSLFPCTFLFCFFSSLCSTCNDFANVLFSLDNQWSGLSGGVSPDWRQHHCHMWEIPYLLLDLERFLTRPQTRHLWRKDTRAYISHRGIKKKNSSPKIQICWKFTHPKAIKDVDELFIHQNLKKFGILSLALCSEWVPSEWESKQLIKNIAIILS